MPRLLLSARPAFALLALTLACGSGSDSTTGPSNAPEGTSNVPAELLGEWHYQFIGVPNCDPDTGQCASTSNQSETLTLSSNGHFEHVFVGESNFPPCSMEVLHQSEGTAEVQGSTLLLHMSKGVTKVSNTCGEDSTSDEAGETDTYAWELSDNNGSPQLTLTNDKGTPLGPFDRK
ncbi:MAG: hypothetical protein ACJ8AV_02470 [Gemmatimonadales bacterium]